MGVCIRNFKTDNMQPKLICLTPVRNEAWCLDVFLKCTSLWADHIIIADQNSSDGSREIALKYPKVILIENKSNEYDEPYRQRMLIDRARQIEGDKILFTLDADEVFSANYKKTDDWQKILNSRPQDVFWFKWAQIESDKANCRISENYFPWMFHDDGLEPHGNYARNIHSMRIPYPIEEKQMYYVDDFKVLHLPFLYTKRQQSKDRYYQCVERLINNYDTITLFRQYQSNRVNKLSPLDKEWIEGYLKYDINIYENLVLNKDKFWFDDEIITLFKKYGIKLFKDICIFDSDWLRVNNLKDPRNPFDKLIHQYLKITKNFYTYLGIRIIDKILKKSLPCNFPDFADSVSDEVTLDH